MSNILKAPFPYFGGKSKIAHKIWQYLGQQKHYIEPFFGSGAVLLLRPDYIRGTHIETVCDKDGMLANVWRALKFKPEETAEWCDWPVNHIDLMARRRLLIKNEQYLIDNLVENDEWSDPKLAGYWIWAASCWIGAGLTRLNARPHISNGGKGVHALGQRPHLSDGGQGVHAKKSNIYDWFDTLSERLRHVRVVCGDWTRVCGGNWQDKSGTVGMYFDPPYGVKDRFKELYHHDSIEIAADVLKWCKERGKLSKYRIVISGYEEYEPLLEDGWIFETWKAQGGYGTKDNKNRYRERLYISPYCINDPHDNMQTKLDL